MEVTGSMELMLTCVGIVMAWMLPSLVIGRWGVSQGKSFWEGFLLSMLVSPLVGAIAVALTGNRNGSRSYHP